MVDFIFFAQLFRTNIIESVVFNGLSIFNRQRGQAPEEAEAGASGSVRVDIRK
jgi:hypothetical protein